MRAGLSSLQGTFGPGRAETWRTDYVARVRRHRAEIRSETDRLGWSFTIHRTDRPASELLLALHTRIGASTTDSGIRPQTTVQPGMTA